MRRKPESVQICTATHVFEALSDQLAFSVGTAKSDPNGEVTVEQLLADADAAARVRV